jgi:hypothetical protein
MRAVMAAEQVGAGREELEDFDEAVDGEPVLMADPSPRATPRRWQATATNFFLGGGYRGKPTLRASRPHRGCALHRGAPEPIKHLPPGGPDY